MSARIRAHLQGNVVGYIAVFIGLSGTAYAVDGPLAGQNQVGSADIINGEVRRDDIAAAVVTTAKVQDETLTAADLGAGSVNTTELQTGSVGGQEIIDDAVGFSEINRDTFNGEIADTGFGSYRIAGNAIDSPEITDGTIAGADIATGAVASADVLDQSLFGQDIGENSISSDEVQDNGINGADIDEGSLAPSIDLVRKAGSDTSFGPTITSRDFTNPTPILTTTIGAGAWLVLAETAIFNNDNDSTNLHCGIYTGATRREFSGEAVEAINDDSGDTVHIPLTATFTTAAPTELSLECSNGEGGTDGDLKTLSPDLVALPVAGLG